MAQQQEKCLSLSPIIQILKTNGPPFNTSITPNTTIFFNSLLKPPSSPLPPHTLNNNDISSVSGFGLSCLSLFAQPTTLSLRIPSSVAHRSSNSIFNGQSLRVARSLLSPTTWNSRKCGLIVMMVKPKIQFIQGTDEQTIPDVRLTNSRDGTNGMAIFKFDQPSVFDSSGEVGDITGFYMIDKEGVIQSVDVNAKFVNGKPAGIEAKYIMRTPREWDRFMRFMERHSNENGLQFNKN